MSAFETQKRADEATERLLTRIVQWAREQGYESEGIYDNGTLPEYGGGYCSTLTINGESFHVEIISPYVEGDNDDNDE